MEDYFHVAAFEGSVRRAQWDRFESRLSRSIDDTLDLFSRHDVRATFFVLGWVAERQPEIVRRIAEAGHEIASRGYLPQRAEGLDRAALREDMARTREVLEAAGSNPIVGYRFGSWLTRRDLWILDVLAEEGYLYDASINPLLRRFPPGAIEHEVYQHRHSQRPELGLWEFPVSSLNLLGVRVPFSGGNYTRQIPHTLLKHAVAWWDRSKQAPMVFYFMPWELDRKQPHVTSISHLNRIRQYRNLEKTRWVLADLLQRYAFQPIGDYLGIPYREQRSASAVATERAPELARPEGLEPVEALLEASLVVPLFNEVQNVPYMAKTLDNLRRELRRTYRLHLVLVDDASQDGTWEALSRRCGGAADCVLLRHERNRGVAAAILTGIQNADHEIVCTIDSDCSYDPAHAGRRWSRCWTEADMVTATPLPPRGARSAMSRAGGSFLSKNLSRLYSLLLGEQLLHLHRLLPGPAQQRDGAASSRERGLPRRRRDPAQAEAGRGNASWSTPPPWSPALLGASKMKTVRTIIGHLCILATLASWSLPPAELKPFHGADLAQRPGDP